MEIKEQIKLKFKGVDFPLVNFKSMKSATDLGDNEIKVKIAPKVFIPKDSAHTFNIIMNVDLVGENHFTLNVIGIGFFELSETDVDEETRKSFINANSTAIMFPYVRAFISTITGNLGNVMNRILLPVRFFKGDLKEMEDEEPEANLIKSELPTTEQ